MNQDSLSKNTSKTFLKGAMIMTVSMVVVKLLGMFYKIFLYRMFATYDEAAGELRATPGHFTFRYGPCADQKVLKRLNIRRK